MGTTGGPEEFRRLSGPWLAAWFRGVGRAWILGGVTVSLGVGIFFLLGSIGVYNLPFILRELPHGVIYLETSLLFTNLSYVFGFFLALPLAISRAFAGSRPVRADGDQSSRAGGSLLSRALRQAAYGFATGYVAVIRGTPFLVQVFVVYFVFIFAFPTLVFLGQPTPFWAGLIALTINTTGYQCEALRGGFQSVGHSQVEAAKAIGMTPGQIFWRITLPQGLRLVTLPLANEWISNFKTSTILSYITIVELYGWARESVAYYLGRPLEAFVILAIFYLAVNVTVSRLVTYIERRRRIPGLGTVEPELGIPSGLLGRVSATRGS